MNRETLYDLRALLALYPYYQTARLLMLQNLYLLHDTSFDEELRRAAIYISDRRVIFQLVEAAHYQLKPASADSGNTPGTTASAANGKDSNGNKSGKADRTSDLIDHFLGSIPMDGQEEDRQQKEKRKPTPADASVDYVAYLMETETQEETEKPSRTISLIDDFIEEGGFKLNKIKSDKENSSDAENSSDKENGSDADNSSDAEKGKNEEKSESNTPANDDEAENSGIFTETLARIYIKQGKYERARHIIARLYKQHPQKSAYYKDQLRFLEKLILNMQSAKKK